MSAIFLGSKGAGKSNVANLFAEGVFKLRVPFIFFDRGSNCFGLRELGPSVVSIGNTSHADPIRRAQRDIDILQDMGACYKIVEAVLMHGYSLVVDASTQPKHDLDGSLNKDGYHNHPLSCFSNFIKALYMIGQDVRRSCILVVDEGQWFAPQQKEIPIQKMSTEALALMAHDSRKAGIGTVILSQRSSYINKRVIFDSNVQIFGRHGYAADYKIIKQYCPEISYKELANLATGEAFMVGPNRTSFIKFNKSSVKNLGGTPQFSAVVDKLPENVANFPQPSQTPVEVKDDWDRI